MRTLAKIGDQLAVSAALVCAIHCFFAPVVVALVTSFQALAIVSDERFHFWMMLGVLPTSVATLAMGCKKHKKATFLAIGFFGLGVLFFASLWGHQVLGCTYEKYLTLAGSLIISFAHINNYLYCRKEKCEESQSSCEAC